MNQMIEELDLWKQYLSTKSPDLREKLVLQSVPLVHYILNRLGLNYQGSDEYADLANQGLLGLIEAVDHFDPSYETQFSTYASLRIRGKILDHMRSSDWMTRSARKRVREIRRVVTEFWAEQQREPTDAEIAQRLNLAIEEVKEGLDDSRRIFVSLDSFYEQTDKRESEGDAYEEIKDDNQPDPAEVFSDGDLKEQMIHALLQLPEREQQVLSLYYVEEFTYKEIGKALGISESRVCQIHSRAIINIKALMKDE
jgi:RNA polymerase sigma factor for flagellar operon FliA